MTHETDRAQQAISMLSGRVSRLIAASQKAQLQSEAAIRNSIKLLRLPTYPGGPYRPRLSQADIVPTEEKESDDHGCERRHRDRRVIG
jgi:hypothetical protein